MSKNKKVDLSDMAVTEGGQIVSKKEMLKQREENSKGVVIKQHGTYWIFDKDVIYCPECDSSDLTFEIFSQNCSENPKQRLQHILYVADVSCRRCGCSFTKTREEIVDIYEDASAYVIEDIKKPIEVVDVSPFSKKSVKGFKTSNLVTAEPKKIFFGSK